MGIGETDPIPPRVYEGKPGRERLEIELGERMTGRYSDNEEYEFPEFPTVSIVQVGESRLENISQMSGEEIGKLERNGSPRIVDIEDTHLPSRDEISRHLSLMDPGNSVGFDMGKPERHCIRYRGQIYSHVLIPVQYYKPKKQ